MGELILRLRNWGCPEVRVSVETSEIRTGQKLLVGIRPEHFIAENGPTINVQVEVVENLGGTAFAYAGTSSDSPLTIELDQTGRGIDLDQLSICLDPTRVYLFDPVSEMRVR